MDCFLGLISAPVPTERIGDNQEAGVGEVVGWPQRLQSDTCHSAGLVFISCRSLLDLHFLWIAILESPPLGESEWLQSSP